MTDNELIAEFMSVTITEHKNYSEKRGGYFDVPDYSKSWDILMPVVGKINSAPFDDMRGVELITTIHKYITKVQILDAHLYVSEFIKWYTLNQNERPHQNHTVLEV